MSRFRASEDAKALYLAPLKALCQEKVRGWKETFGGLGEVVELTGDDERMLSNGKGRGAARLAKARVIVATPEMWDALMRQAGRSKGFGIIEDLQLVCLDEVHMLNMPKRGALLEAVIARLQALRHGLAGKSKPPRFVAVSATVPNVSDVAAWIQVDRPNLKAFGMEFRPVPLRIHVQSYKSAKNEFVFQDSLNHHLTPLLQQFSGGKATLVFCVTKRACETAAKSLQQEALGLVDPRFHALLKEKAASLTDATFKSLVPDGLAYHHAGLNATDRRLVEELFLQSAILVLFCTQTLALGVNLPARLVIVKGTTCYKDHGWEEYDDLEMLQIMGRAGRPQFDQQGIAVIMTESQNERRWQQIIAGRPLESRLPGNLTEALLAEIVAQTTPDLPSLCIWLKKTFLAVRCTRDPGQYASLCPVNGCGVHPLLGNEGPDAEAFLDALCQQEIQKLHTAGLIRSGTDLQATALGEVASRHAVRYDTICWLQNAPAPGNLKELLWLVAQTADFEEFRPRHGEKTQLRELAKNAVRQGGQGWPLVGPVDSAAKKVLVLVMLALADSPRRSLPWELKSQQSQVLKRAEPLLRVVAELFETRKEGCALAACMLMRNCLRKQIWEDSMMLVRQLPNIGDVGAHALKQRGLSSFQAFLCGDPRMIEVVLGRRPPYGNTLQNKLRSVVRIQLRLCPQGSDGSIAIQFVLPSDADLKKVKANESLGTGFVHCLAYAAPSGQLLLHRRFPSQNPQDGLLVNLQNNKGLVVHLIHEDLVGFDDLQVIGDVQIAPRCPVNNVHSEGSTTVQPARSKRQKVETLRGHEATFAMARARQGTQIETLSSSFASPSPLPAQGRQNAFQMTPMTQRAWVTQSCGHGSTPNQLQRLQFTSGSPMQTTMQPSVPPAMPRVRSDVQVEQPMRQTAAGRWRLSGNASQANGPGFPAVGQGFPAVSTVGSDHFRQFPKQFVRASDM